MRVKKHGRILSVSCHNVPVILVLTLLSNDPYEWEDHHRKIGRHELLQNFGKIFITLCN